MRRHDVPEQHLVLDAELGEHAVHDRRRRLGRAGTRELALGSERNPADACAAVAGGLADEHDPRARASLEIGAEAIAAAATTPRTGCTSSPMLAAASRLRSHDQAGTSAVAPGATASTRSSHGTRLQPLERLARLVQQRLSVLRPPACVQPLPVLELDDGGVERHVETAKLGRRRGEVAICAGIVPGQVCAEAIGRRFEERRAQSR